MTFGFGYSTSCAACSYMGRHIQIKQRLIQGHRKAHTDTETNISVIVAFRLNIMPYKQGLWVEGGCDLLLMGGSSVHRGFHRVE